MEGLDDICGALVVFSIRCWHVTLLILFSLVSDLVPVCLCSSVYFSLYNTGLRRGTWFRKNGFPVAFDTGLFLLVEVHPSYKIKILVQ